MGTSKTFMEKTAAPGASAGFDYQYYYFLYKTLNLKKGQSVGLEIKDDVHTDVDNDLQLLFQLKHTIQKQADGKPVALTELDTDLWKTLHNWAKVISDQNDGRATEAAQLTFVSKTEFHLVTNKSTSCSNKFGIFLASYVEDHTLENLEEILSRITELKTSTSDDAIRRYISAVTDLAPSVKQEFFKKIHFELSEIEIIQKIKNSIAEKFIPPSKIDEVYERLNTNIRDSNYIEILNGKAFSVVFDDFTTKYSSIFQDARDNKLSNLRFEPPLPDDLLSQPFIQQLLAIDDVYDHEEEIIMEYSTHKLRIARSLEQWEQNGEVVHDEIQALHSEVHLRWNNNHRIAFRGCRSDEVKEKGRAIINTMRQEKYRLGKDELSTEYSNGELYELSDLSRIGWHRDWEKL
ncbi:ABC-three component system protein [Pseudomonas guineae]|uniref:ABC-three component system protein n=1 Tax=Pseudomonas guineae TaxID=425504 RepID=UPI003CFE02C7